MPNPGHIIAYYLFAISAVGFQLCACGVKTTPKSNIEDFRPEASYLENNKEQTGQLPGHK